MRVFGFEITRAKAQTLNGVDDRGWHKVFDSYPGAWQQNVELSVDTATTYPTVFACITQIATDIGKLGLGLRSKEGGIWSPTESAAFSPVLRKPNPFQSRQQFIETWMQTVLLYGNFYALKARDARGVVVRLYPLDPSRVRPLVSDTGDVFYELNDDKLARVESNIPAAPASEIIHARIHCLFHPLVGISPLYAAALAARMGLNAQDNSAKFFGNASQPGGILTAPNRISDETAARLKAHWEKSYSGDNVGKIAVLGDGLKYEALARTAAESQLIDQLKWADEKICSVFKVPPWRIYVGQMPTYQNAEILTQIYYDGCLHSHIEAIEAALDEGISVPSGYRTEFDLEDLLRMDSATRMDTAIKGVTGGIMKPNEARNRFNLAGVPGGDTPYLQQQNYSLAALDERDRNDPFAKPAPVAAPAPPPQEDGEQAQEQRAAVMRGFKEMLCA